MAELVKENPYIYGLYKTSRDTYRLLPKYDKNKNNNIKLKSRALSKNGKTLYTFNDKGQIKLTFRDGKEIKPKKKK